MPSRVRVDRGYRTVVSSWLELLDLIISSRRVFDFDRIRVFLFSCPTMNFVAGQKFDISNNRQGAAERTLDLYADPFMLTA